ncbi:hypothetical protein Patl1_14629 [Pistacia atlantica]|uniref:Uncharacterized protein n=1 Tax=Pistacia atlantica TaxID=434234 RepID=A0ACC1ASY2_9ROSI|nr:hypothetical protein Patl1_14629 [Pistacia atlantica]
MGFCFFSSILVLALFFKPLLSQQPNTDGFYVSEFFKKTSSKSFQASYFSSPVCSWQGVTCDSQNEHVTALVVPNLGLSGPVPDATIGKLTKLQVLDLSNNKITAFPGDLWSLGSLTTLNLSNNQISGSLPNNIGNFGSLEVFDLSHNNLSGEIPAAISSLVSLQVLKLDNNMFQYSIPQGIKSCQSLVTIDLSMNQLNGSLPDGFGAAFPKLKSLNLAGNEISGRDSDLTGMKSISRLNISWNLFQGSVMGVFQEPLQVIDLSRNQFQGHISQVQFNSSYNWSRLVYLDLSENQLSGEIFRNLSQAQNLKHLNLAYNRFSRQEFLEIEMLWSLEYLNLSRTSLTGHIPSEISELSSLHTLDLSMNHLSGHIPLLSIKNLEIIDVSRNNLSGEIPVSLLGKLPYLDIFNFSYNNLTLCASEISPEILQKAFLGSSNNCPIAANPSLFRRKATKHKGLKLALALTLSMVCLLAGLLFVAFGCRRKPKMWVCPVVIFEKPLLNITFADLLSATSNFDRGTLLAEGKFGPVYRGFLPGGIHVALETITQDEKEATLVSWVRGLVRKNQGSRAIDPKIHDTGPENQMEEALKIGYLCTADLPLKRPSMQQIVGLLKDIGTNNHSSMKSKVR